MICDLIVKNGNIITLDSGMPFTKKWMAVTDGKIVAIGDGNDMPEAASVIDIKGKTVLPGFIDTHVHGTLTGEALQAVNLDGVTSVAEVLDSLSKYNSCGSIITANSFSPDIFYEDLFSAEDLDEIASDKIILIYDKSYHGCYLNTRGIEAAKIKPGMPGVVVKDGKMTGAVIDDTSYYFSIKNIMKSLDDEVVKSYMQAVNTHAVSKGITTIHSLDGGDFEIDMPAWIIHKDILDIDVINYWETLDFTKVEPYNLPRIGGCICLDGTRTLHTMALMKPYYDKPLTRGPLYYKESDVMEFVKTAHEKGMQCAMHAAGPRAIDQYIYCLYEVIKSSEPKDLRHRIEHFSYPTEEQIEMAVELNLALPMQPIFTKVWDEGENSLYKRRFGTEEAAKVEPIADILAAGGMVCGGSDSPVTIMNPLAGIDACVNNYSSHRKISMLDALKIFTINGAWAAHEEQIKGSLSIGKKADFIVLDKDPFYYEKDVAELSVEKTFINGKIVYEA